MIIGRPKSETEARVKLIRAAFARLNTDALRERLFNKQSGRCLLCSGLHLDGWSPSDWELQGWDTVVSALDHFVSIYEFASRVDLSDEQAITLANHESNLVLLHPSCNVVKGPRDIEEVVEDIKASRIAIGRPQVWTPEDTEREKQRRFAVASKVGRKNVESGHLASLRTPEHQARNARRRNELYGNPQTLNGSRKGGRAGGRKAVESGHLASIRTPESCAKGGRKNVESGHLASISAKGGRASAKLGVGVHAPEVRTRTGRIAVESGQIQALGRSGIGGRIGGRKNAESGHLIRLNHRWHIKHNILKPGCTLCA